MCPNHHRNNFFKSSLVQQLMAENRLMPKSESWWEQELVEKREILEAFWNERIVKLNRKSVDSFMEQMINIGFPQNQKWKEQVKKLFLGAVSGRIDFETFFNTLKHIPLMRIKGMESAEKLIKHSAWGVREEKVEIEPMDLVNIKRYMLEKGISASVSLGIPGRELITPEFFGGKPSSYAMHSVGKVFTGVLALIMMRNKIILDDDLNSPPVKLDEAVKKVLPAAVRERLEKVSLHQLMTHKAGLGDYLGGYFTAIAKGEIPEMKTVEDFLQFAEEKVSNVGDVSYSNLGILLVGLAIKHAYEKKHGPCDYNEILQKYIIKEVGMPSFTPWKPKDAKFNSADFIAPHVMGSPAGGYWVTAEDLARFGQWLYKQTKADSELEPLMKKYGQEFYNTEHRVVAHSGGIPSSSAFLFVSLETGAVIATLSDQPDMAFDLNSMIQKNICWIQPEISEQEDMKALPKNRL